MASIERVDKSIPAIRASADGKTFVWYGDCCSGIPGGSNEANFAAVNTVFQRLEAMPDVAFFVGDNIMGYLETAEQVREQWRYWFGHEMAWFHPLGVSMYHITSNHNTSDELAETVFREIHADIPQNGPDDQKGLSYWVRDGEFLYVFVNTNFSGRNGFGHVEHEWLDGVLTDQADARFKLVIGHHPIHAVNGYQLYPTWRVAPEDGQPFWDTLVQHGVLAYICSHILLFDVQVHRGVLQIATGGAGTYGMPVVGLMPDAYEYLHLVQAAIDETGVRYQVLDTDGVAREWLQWPEPALESPDFAMLEPTSAPQKPATGCWIAHFSISGYASLSEIDQTILTGSQTWEGPEAIWVGMFEGSNRLTVQLVPEPGQGAQRWDGPRLAGPFDLEIAIHSGMGPGGVLWRETGGVWSSLWSSTARGASQLAWPEAWNVGHGPSGNGDRPFVGSELNVNVATSGIESPRTK